MHPYHMSCVLFQNQWTPLHCAAANNDAEVMESLIKVETNVNAVELLFTMNIM